MKATNRNEGRRRMHTMRRWWCAWKKRCLRIPLVPPINNNQWVAGIRLLRSSIRSMEFFVEEFLPHSRAHATERVCKRRPNTEAIQGLLLTSFHLEPGGITRIPSVQRLHVKCWFKSLGERQASEQNSINQPKQIGAEFSNSTPTVEAAPELVKADARPMARH